MSKLAIIFPGVSYSAKSPLFYYARRLLDKNGFDIIDLSYEIDGSTNYPELFKEKPDQASAQFKKDMLRYVVEAESKCVEQLKDLNWEKYDHIAFVSKGVGSMIAALFAQKHEICPAQIMFAPLEPTFQLIRQEEGIVFCGMDDDLVKYDRIKSCCEQTNLAVYHFENCNHSLESEDVLEDLRNLEKIMSMTDAFLKHYNRTIYDFEVLDLDQTKVALSKYENQVILIVNTATGCGFTPQYTQLEELYQAYHKQGFIILDFPCNQFLNQAPGSDAEIHSFCESRYNIHFPQYSKIHVNGDKEDPLYTYLKSKRGFRGFDLSTLDGQYLDKKVRSEFPDYKTSSDIKWNFTKFLVNAKGQVVERYEPTTDFEIIKADIEKLLPANNK